MFTNIKNNLSKFNVLNILILITFVAKKKV